MNLGALDRGAQLRRYQHIVDSPSYVARPRIGKVTPPRIMPVALGEKPKRVDESRVDKSLEARAFLVGKALFAAIWFWVGKVQLGMRDVEIAAKYHRLGCFQLLAISQE